VPTAPTNGIAVGNPTGDPTGRATRGNAGGSLSARARQRNVTHGFGASKPGCLPEANAMHRMFFPFEATAIY